MAVSPKVFRVATYNFACLQASLYHTISFLGQNWKWSHGNFKKKLLENFSYYEMIETCLPKQIISVRRSIAHYINFLTQSTTHHRLQNGTILKFPFMFPHNELCMQKVASVTFMRFLKIHNFIIYHPNSK